MSADKTASSFFLFSFSISISDNEQIRYIIGGESDLMALHDGISQNDKELALVLIKAMIASNPSERPPVMAVHDHPIFWEPATILEFFQVLYLYYFIPSCI